MSDYVDIATSIPEILGIANRLRERGQELESAMSDAAAEIERQENRQETFPRDKFTEQFLANYHTETEYSQGDQVLTGGSHIAVRATAVEMGRRLSEVGEWVGHAMFTYAAQNEENATDISSAPNA